MHRARTAAATPTKRQPPHQSCSSLRTGSCLSIGWGILPTSAHDVDISTLESPLHRHDWGYPPRISITPPVWAPFSAHSYEIFSGRWWCRPEARPTTWILKNRYTIQTPQNTKSSVLLGVIRYRRAVLCRQYDRIGGSPRGLP